MTVIRCSRVVTSPSGRNLTSEDVTFSCGHLKYGLQLLQVSGTPKGTIFYCPGRWQNEKIWSGEDDKDFRLVLLSQGISVATLRYPSSYAGNEAIEPCWSAEYDLSAHVNMASHALNWLQSEFSILPTVICGYSAGAAIGLLSILRSTVPPAAGFIALDGGLTLGRRSHEGCHPTVQWSSKSIENPAWNKIFRRFAVSELTRRCSGSAEILNKAPASISEQSTNALRLLLAEDRWWPTSQVRDLAALRKGIADSTDEVVRNLGQLEMPVLAIEAGMSIAGRERILRGTINHMKSADVTLLSMPEWKHIDVLTHADVSKCINQPIAGWVDAQLSQ